jgi:hypothetical protein
MVAGPGAAGIEAFFLRGADGRIFAGLDRPVLVLPGSAFLLGLELDGRLRTSRPARAAWRELCPAATAACKQAPADPLAKEAVALPEAEPVQHSTGHAARKRQNRQFCICGPP